MAPIARPQHVHSLTPLIAWCNVLGATIVGWVLIARGCTYQPMMLQRVLATSSTMAQKYSLLPRFTRKTTRYISRYIFWVSLSPYFHGKVERE